jgi:hypothetical protein
LHIVGCKPNVSELGHKCIYDEAAREERKRLQHTIHEHYPNELAETREAWAGGFGHLLPTLRDSNSARTTCLCTILAHPIDCHATTSQHDSELR